MTVIKPNDSGLDSAQVVPQTNRIVVATAGGDVTSFEDAISLAIPGTLILVGPETFDYSSKQVPPIFTSIVGLDPLTSILNCTTANIVGIECSGFNGIGNLTLSGPSGATGVGVDVPSGVTLVRASGVLFSGCGTGFRDASGTSTVLVDNTNSFNCTESGVHITGGSTTDLHAVNAQGSALATLTNGILIDGGSTAFIRATKIDGAGGGFVTNGIHVDGGNARCAALVVTNADSALVIGDLGGDIVHSGGDISGSVTNDIKTGTGVSRIFMDGSIADATKFSVGASTTLHGSHIVETEDEEGTQFLGGVVVGKPGNGQQLSMGEGDAFTVGMHVLTNTNLEIGTWVDESANAASASGSTVTLFSGVTADHATYVGYTESAVTSLLTKMSTTAIDLGAGSISVSYWDGATYIDVVPFASDAASPHKQHAQGLFERTSQTDNIRVDTLDGLSTAKTLNSITAHWLRFLIVADITTSPVLEQIRLRLNQGYFGNEALLEVFGKDQPDLPLPISQRYAINGSSPTTAVFDLSANIILEIPESKFAGNAKDAFGVDVTTPSNLDTSRPLIITVLWSVDGAAAGDVELELFLLQGFVAGDNIDSGTLTETPITPIVTTIGAGSGGVMQSTVFSVCVPDVTEGDEITFMLQRDATGGNDPPDTLTAAIQIFKFSVVGKSWHN